MCKIICTFILFCDPHEDNCLPKWPAEEKSLGVTELDKCSYI